MRIKEQETRLTLHEHDDDDDDDDDDDYDTSFVLAFNICLILLIFSEEIFAGICHSVICLHCAGTRPVSDGCCLAPQNAAEL